MVTLDTNETGCLYGKSQVTDYALHGSSLEDQSILEFFMNTYEERKGPLAPTSEDVSPAIGRHHHTCIPYLTDHPRYQQTRRVLYAYGHNNLPNFIGHQFPCRDDAETYSFYCVCMLMLLKPWRDVKKDLKTAEESWTDSFDCFMASSSTVNKWCRDVLAGIYYLHDCESSALNLPVNTLEESTQLLSHNKCEEIDAEDEPDNPSISFTPAVLEDIIASQTLTNEFIHGRMAVELGKHAGFFGEYSDDWDIKPTFHITTASTYDVEQLEQWRQHLQDDIAYQNIDTVAWEHDRRTAETDVGPSVTPLTIQDMSPTHTTSFTPSLSSE